MQRTFLIRSLSLTLGLTSICFGQSHGGFGSGYVSGGVLHPPTIGALGRPVPNAPGNGAYNRGSRNRYGYGYGIGAYPVYIGGLSGDYYSGYGDPSLVGASYGPGYAGVPPSAPAAPAVVINQYFGAPPGGPSEDPNVQVYSDTQRESAPVAAAPEPRTYLIAYADHSVYSALAYWIEDHTLHYVTTQNTHNQADLSLIDVEFTKKLNQDRNMPFSLVPTR